MKKICLVCMFIILLCGCNADKTMSENINNEENIVDSDYEREEKGEEVSENEVDEKVDKGIIGNKNSKKYHLPSCYALPHPKNQVLFESEEDAESDGYIPCQKCWW